MLLARNLFYCLVLAGWGLGLAGCSPAPDDTSFPPLQQAVARNDAAAITELLASGTSPDAGEPNPLHLAVSRGSGAAAEILLMAGALTETRNEDGLRPLDVAVREGKLALADVLLRYGALPDPDTTHPDQPEVCAPLFYAAQQGNAALVESLLARGANPQLACGTQVPADVAPTPNLADRLRNAVQEIPGL